MIPKRQAVITHLEKQNMVLALTHGKHKALGNDRVTK